LTQLVTIAPVVADPALIARIPEVIEAVPSRRTPEPGYPATELQLIYSRDRTVSKRTLDDLLIDPVDHNDTIVMIDDPADEEKYMANNRSVQVVYNRERLIQGIIHHHLIPDRCMELTAINQLNNPCDGATSTTILIQKIGCPDYGVYQNEHEYLIPICTCNGLFPYGYHGVIGYKCRYALPSRAALRDKYSCEVFIGQVTLVLANRDLFDIFWRELTSQKLGGNREVCELYLLRQPLYSESCRAQGATRIGGDIWEHYSQWEDSTGVLIDLNDYSVSHHDQRGSNNQR
jgi:hypothetical protein